MKKLILSLLVLGQMLATQAMHSPLHEQLETIHQSFKINANTALDRQIVAFDKHLHGDQAQELYRACFDDPAKSEEENRNAIPRILTGAPSGSKAKILLTQNTVLGFIIYRDFIKDAKIDIAGKITTMPLKTRSIDHLGVNSSYRNQNNGTYFMQEIEKQAHLEGVMRITLNADPKALNFYTRLHFVTQVAGPKYIQMQKMLTKKNDN